MKKIKTHFNNENGFTLIETSIVLLVIALLTILILPNVSGVTDQVDNSTAEAIIATVETQELLYKSNNPSKTYEGHADLVKHKYITQAQLEAYKKAIENHDSNE